MTPGKPPSLQQTNHCLTMVLRRLICGAATRMLGNTVARAALILLAGWPHKPRPDRDH